MEPQLENFTEPQIPKKNSWSRFMGIPIGIVFLLISWFSFSIPQEEKVWMHVVGIFLLLLGLQLVIHPFRKVLQKYFLTRIFYWVFQIVSGIAFFLMYLFKLFGRVIFAVLMFFGLLVIITSKSFEYFGVENPLEVGLFLGYTISAIVFSFKGNSFVKWFAVLMEGFDKKKAKPDLEIVNKYLGQSQIKYLIYCLYFVLILLFTTQHLMGKLSTDSDQNYMFLTLQSFAAFFIFETIVEKRHLMTPWFEAFQKSKQIWTEVKRTPAKEIFKEDDDK